LRKDFVTNSVIFKVALAASLGKHEHSSGHVGRS
jgi:hypothetical protein